MINKHFSLKVLAVMQEFTRKGMLLPKERALIADMCKTYTRSGDDDEFCERLDWCSKNLSQNVVKQKFKEIKEEIYNDNDSQNYSVHRQDNA